MSTSNMANPSAASSPSSQGPLIVYYTNPTVGIVYTNAGGAQVSTATAGINDYTPASTNPTDRAILYTNPLGATSTSYTSAIPSTPSVISSSWTSPATTPQLTTKHDISTTAKSEASSASSVASHGSTSSNDRLPNGTVAGIVIAVAVGIALLTSLATFLVMRHKRNSGSNKDYGEPNGRGVFGADSVNQRSQGSEPKRPLVTEISKTTGSFESHLPQSADDKTIQNNAKTMLDQIELHVENFYQGVAQSSTRPVEADITTFNSPYLSHPLAELLTESRKAVPLIKHALTHVITDSISLIANPYSTLLPDEFVLLPSTVKAANTSVSAKPGFAQCMSRWRLLTAYLRPKPSQDPTYISERDQRINEIVKVFSRAFAPWKSLKYSDEDRVQSLSATLKDAADLGLLMFEQPPDLQFQWSKQSEVGTNRIAIAPALIKLTDEKGNTLLEPQIMLKSVLQRI